VSVPLDILTALAPHFPTSHRVLGQPVQISNARWTQVGQRTSDPQVGWALSAYPRSITRSDIIGLRHEDPNVRRRRVAIASLMWGYGIKGTRWGTWVSDVSNFLSPTLDTVLADCEAHLTAGAIAEAYKLFTRCPGPGDTELENHRGIGFPFITKILYFLARNSPDDAPAEYPLILDTEVSKALAQLTGYRLLVRPADYRPRPDSTAYVLYVKAMHAWASQLKVLPEVIEYYLWTEASKRGSPLWPACQAQHALNFP
jgi:Putative 8-oxoguanine DNA glycosylase OGG-like protein